MTGKAPYKSDKLKPERRGQAEAQTDIQALRDRAQRSDARSTAASTVPPGLAMAKVVPLLLIVIELTVIGGVTETAYPPATPIVALSPATRLVLSLLGPMEPGWVPAAHGREAEAAPHAGQDG